MGKLVLPFPLTIERAALVRAQLVAQNTAKHRDAVFDDLKHHFKDAAVA